MSAFRSFLGCIVACIATYLIYMSGWILFPMLPFIIYCWVACPNKDGFVISRFARPLFFFLCGYNILLYGSFFIMQWIEYPNYGNVFGMILTVFNFATAMYSAFLAYTDNFQREKVGISQEPDGGAASDSNSEPLKKASVQKEILPPESDYEEWYSTLFVTTSKCSQKIAKIHSDEETLGLFASFFDVGLFTILLMTDNHDFVRYCFSSLQKALAESPLPSSYQQFVDHYDYIIDVYNECVKEEQNDMFLRFRAITESSVDYFYKEGDDLEHSYQVRDALMDYVLGVAQTFKERYSKK